MNEKIITILILIAQLLPMIATCSIIGWIMHKASKDRKDVRLGGLIFSWLYFAFYVTLCCSIVIFRHFDKEAWSNISVIILVLSLVLLILIAFIGSALTNYHLNHGETKIVEGKLIGAVEKMSTSTRRTGREPVANNFYSLVFEYEEEGIKKICTTNKLYKLSQVAYINEKSKNTIIRVYKNICALEMDMPVVSDNYDLEDIKNLKISSMGAMGSSQHYIEIFATLAFTIPIFVVTTLIGLMLWEDSASIAAVTLIIGLVIVFVPVIVMIPHCRRKIKITKYGVETFALSFGLDLKNSTPTTSSYCIIEYSFQTNDGIKIAKERVTIYTYGKIIN